MFSGGGEGDTGLGRINMMPTAAMLSPSAEVSPRGPPQQQPQWGLQETKEFIGIRAELEKDFTVTKRNKTLWEIVSAKMREKGYRRTPEQCKCKWKNLVNRYKIFNNSSYKFLYLSDLEPTCALLLIFAEGYGHEGIGLTAVRESYANSKLAAVDLCVLVRLIFTMEHLISFSNGKETSDPETGRQCPFFEELHAVFTERAKNMQRLFLESEAGSTQSRKKVKKTSGDRSSDEFSEEEDEDDDDSEEEKKPVKSNSRKRKVEKIKVEKSPRASSSTGGGIQEMLKEFLQQQQKMEMQWREMMERRSHERQLFEQEWRQSMEKLERERLMIEQAWRDKEEQRRIREESRAERRDALLTTLLNKLIRLSRKEVCIVGEE
ncbi:hypothetical protein DKX38_000976 [Salix brachista]|uniref:Myb-like domain-containing protein n=1 Tax=Salix brachista TaxID=2182728 RepID=A0A5N5P2E4_9ROSI|nr:hypothetical protein DKX38_000976 [Salix brachista]